MNVDFQIDLLSWLKGKPIGVTGESTSLLTDESIFDLGRLLAGAYYESNAERHLTFQDQTGIRMVF